MVLARISGAGLIWIATLVAMLWACILGEHMIVRRANRDLNEAMLGLRQLQLKKQTVPVSLPAAPHRNRPSIG
jgi:hypothetical protein